mmetsp:Transcript_11056/g.28306  ORF Transcript_11056/g.28306 Transcript_11056/m.28306 type:complete len:234 (+) Transcript_11056:87-788(+)
MVDLALRLASMPRRSLISATFAAKLSPCIAGLEPEEGAAAIAEGSPAARGWTTAALSISSTRSVASRVVGTFITVLSCRPSKRPLTSSISWAACPLRKAEGGLSGFGWAVADSQTAIPMSVMSFLVPSDVAPCWVRYAAPCPRLAGCMRCAMAEGATVVALGSTFTTTLLVDDVPPRHIGAEPTLDVSPANGVTPGRLAQGSYASFDPYRKLLATGMAVEAAVAVSLAAGAAS